MCCISIMGAFLRTTGLVQSDSAVVERSRRKSLFWQRSTDSFPLLLLSIHRQKVSLEDSLQRSGSRTASGITCSIKWWHRAHKSRASATATGVATRVAYQSQLVAR